MKYFNHIIAIIVLLIFNFMIPRSLSTPSQRQPLPTPKPATPVITIPVQPKPIPKVDKPVIAQPIKNESYKDLVSYVKNARNTWDVQKGLLNASFVTTIVQKGKAANLEPFQIEALLQTARDVHGIFSGNPQKDIAILQSVDKQINNAVLQ
jgi:hypothetical protein